MLRQSWRGFSAGIVGLMLSVAEAAHGAATTNTVADPVDDAYAQMELLAEVMLHVKAQYVEEKTYAELMQDALDGMLRKLDPHSAFLGEEAFGEMQDETSATYSGVGLQLGVREGFLTVVAPMEDGPAFKAGILSGDRIEAINGLRALDMPLKDAVDLLRGAKGEKVSLTVRRQGREEPLRFELTRDEIVVATVKGTRLVDGKVGYIRITQFSAPTAEALQKALEDLIGQGMQALVLDLRGNAGGLLASSIAVAQKFLRRGDVVVTTRGREGVYDEASGRALGDTHYLDFPIAVLVNGGTASAAEIVAGALQDHKRAVLIGETTFGKGSVQSLIRVGSEKKQAVRLTTQRYFTPSGRMIHDIGIEPDVWVPMAPEEWQRAIVRRAHVENPDFFTAEEKEPFSDAVDRQLQRAIDVLQAVNVFEAARR